MSIYIYIYLFPYLFIHLLIYLLIYLFIYLLIVCLFTYIDINVYVVLSDPRHTECSNLTEVDGHNIYVIMKTKQPLSYHHDDFMSAKCNSCTWAHNNRKSFAQEHELTQSHSDDNLEDTLFSWFQMHMNVCINVCIHVLIDICSLRFI